MMMTFLDCDAMSFRKGFRDCDSGAVTVDWVVLTAIVVVLFVFAVSPVWVGFEDIVQGTADEIDNYTTPLLNRN